MTWKLYDGKGIAHDVVLPEPPPWRRFPIQGPDEGGQATFRPTDELVDAVNAALYLRRPLLVTGPPGSGKSSVAESVAHELKLGPVLRWHVTSHSTLEDAIYRYDALGRLQHNQLRPKEDDIASFLRLGPLGSALVAMGHPRVLLIDELDKSDLDLPGDLLNVLDRGEYVIPELNRLKKDVVPIRTADGDEVHELTKGRISCKEFPFVVMTSNGEREFPAAFLRRCVRVRLELPDETRLRDIIVAHFDDESVADDASKLIEDFAKRIKDAQNGRARLAVDQLLNAVFMVTSAGEATEAERTRVLELLQRELDRS